MGVYCDTVPKTLSSTLANVAGARYPAPPHAGTSGLRPARQENKDESLYHPHVPLHVGTSALEARGEPNPNAMPGQ